MTSPPTLTVDGPADDWLPGATRDFDENGEWVGVAVDPRRCWVPVETLPSAPMEKSVTGEQRWLRVGDTVTLVAGKCICNGDSPPGPECDGEQTFASATVAEILVIDGRESRCPATRRGAYVNAADELWVYDALGETLVARGATPGGYGIRLSNVEALA